MSFYLKGKEEKEEVRGEQMWGKKGKRKGNTTFETKQQAEKIHSHQLGQVLITENYLVSFHQKSINTGKIPVLIFLPLAFLLIFVYDMNNPFQNFTSSWA